MDMKYSKSSCQEFSEEQELQLFRIFQNLNDSVGATYMSYTFDIENKYRYSFRTDSNWASIYHTELYKGKPLIEVCPLDIVSREESNKVILWDGYKHPCQPKAFKEIMSMREDLGLNHGITLSTYFHGNHDAIALATEESKNKLSNRCLETSNLLRLKQALVDCRNLILKEWKRSSDK